MRFFILLAARSGDLCRQGGRLSRAIGVPLTPSGRERKLGAIVAILPKL